MADKKAFITGGSRGIGRGTALVLAEGGYDIAVTFDQSPADTETLKKAVEAYGSRFFCCRAELDRPGAHEEAAAKAIETLGGIDLLVCGPSLPVRQSALEADADTLDYYYRLNYKSYLLCAKVAANHMIERKTGGSIVFITTTEGLRAYKDDLIYGSFAAAVHRSAESMAMQFAPYGIRVNCIAPGITDTKENSPEKESPLPFKHRIPLGRLAVPADIGRLVEFLSSEKADYITGMTIKVDGGLILPGMPESDLPQAGYGWEAER